MYRLLRSTYSQIFTRRDLTAIVQVFIEAELFHWFDIFGPVKFYVLLDFVALVFADITITLKFFTVIFNLLLRWLDFRDFTLQLVKRVFLLFQFNSAVIFHFVASLRIDQQFSTRFIVFFQLVTELGFGLLQLVNVFFRPGYFLVKLSQTQIAARKSSPVSGDLSFQVRNLLSQFLQSPLQIPILSTTRLHNRTGLLFKQLL